MKDTLLKWFDFLAEGFWKELVYPILMWVLIITLASFLLVGLVLLAAMLGIADYNTSMTALLNFATKPWW
ncbi:hypothetical protein [Methylotenera sp. N17]|uniref:hypothetical protein n=1 Tax=Methylotenera sp. N17 TaxID=1502761 RepID=UPI0006478149|nr:hypothetical protein [Methylotenera sp. N17]